MVVISGDGLDGERSRDKAGSPGSAITADFLSDTIFAQLTL